MADQVQNDFNFVQTVTRWLASTEHATTPTPSETEGLEYDIDIEMSQHIDSVILEAQVSMDRDFVQDFTQSLGSSPHLSTPTPSELDDLRDIISNELFVGHNVEILSSSTNVAEYTMIHTPPPSTVSIYSTRTSVGDSFEQYIPFLRLPVDTNRGPDYPQRTDDPAINFVMLPNYHGNKENRCPQVRSTKEKKLILILLYLVAHNLLR
jgi:hypothetical protein